MNILYSISADFQIGNPGYIPKEFLAGKPAQDRVIYIPKEFLAGKPQ